MKAISKWVDSVGGWFGGPGERATPGSTPEAPQEESAVSLFRCPDCESVYVAIDKDTCSTCETRVEEVP